MYSTSLNYLQNNIEKEKKQMKLTRKVISRKTISRKVISRKIISGILSMSLSVTLLVGIPFNINGNGRKAKAESMVNTDTSYEEAVGVNVTYHTQEEIRNYVKNSGVSLNDPLEFSEEPVTTKPYSLGKLSDKTLQSALKMLNQVRYIAGIADNVELSDEYNTLCQAGSLVNYINDELSHYPVQPDGMPDDMYQLACNGAGSSNIAYSWGSLRNCSLNNTIISMWMEDGDSGNIDRVGHRRWLINPSMGKTGFGAVSGNNSTYSCVFSFDRSNTSAKEYGVMWPAQNMPIEYFGKEFPWSISMDNTVDKNAINVTLTRKNDGKTWNFSNSSSDGPFYVNNDGYGQQGCIIFRPDDITKYNSGDVFKVEITGLSNSVSYTVSFFGLTSSETPSPEITPSPVPVITERPEETPSPSLEVTQKPAETATASPSVKPSQKPAEIPTVSPEGTQKPAGTVSPSPKATQTAPSASSSQAPGGTSGGGSGQSTAKPSQTPGTNSSPSARPTQKPAAKPSPSVSPTQKPAAKPSPSVRPSQKPTSRPSPSVRPSQKPTIKPTQKPTLRPSPSARPTVTPSATKTPVQTPLPSATEEPGNNITPDEGYEKPSGINVAYHTQEEIKNYARNSNVSLEDALEFEEEPVTKSPYSLGKLSGKTLQSALKMLNQVRYIAGISDNVELSDEYNTLCQAGALANYANNELSHFPEKPVGMPDDMYELAEQGAGSSNIAWASWHCSLNDTIVSSWMEDGDPGNIDRTGHRRWLINPEMGKTGFGAVSGKNGTYSCVYSFDRSNSHASEYGVAWPAQNMPVEYFGSGFPWSVSMGYDVDEDDVNVTLVRKNDGRTWNFSNASSEGPFYVNNDGYGQTGCIIFRPDDITYKAGDIFKVEITGLDNPVSYTVNFFELDPSAQKDNNNTDNSIKKGTKITDSSSKAIYKITGTGKNKTVTYVKSTKKNPVNAIIPNTININGITYKVTSIGKEAFKNNKKLKSVQIGRNITSIGQKAFSGCKKLDDITIYTNKLTAKSIGKKAFSKGNSKPKIKADIRKWQLYKKIFKSKGMSKKCKFKTL